MEICVICQDVITDETVCIPCGHRFCYSCIIVWNLQNNTCPHCRTHVISLLFSVSIYNVLRRTFRTLNMVYRRQYANESVISNPAIICFIICAVPFILVYGDMGIRYMYSPISKGCQYTLQATKNITFKKAGMMFNVTYVSKQINQSLQNAVECFEIFFHEELSVFYSILKFIHELYLMMLQMANLIIDGIYNELLQLYELFSLIVTDIYHCLKLIISYMVFLVVDVVYGLWDVMKVLWEFVKNVTPVLGWFIIHACMVGLRMLIYYNITRFVLSC